MQHLAAALAQHADGTARRLWIVTDGLHDLVGGERLDPVKATVLGPCRVIGREHPRLRCGSVDVVLDGALTPTGLDGLLAEFAAEPGHAAVAHRGGHRWVRTRPRGGRAILGRPTRPGVDMASKRKGGIAPYVALLVAVIIFVPPVREVVADLSCPVVDRVKDAFGR